MSFESTLPLFCVVCPLLVVLRPGRTHARHATRHTCTQQRQHNHAPRACFMFFALHLAHGSHAHPLGSPYAGHGPQGGGHASAHAVPFGGQFGSGNITNYVTTLASAHARVAVANSTRRQLLDGTQRHPSPNTRVGLALPRASNSSNRADMHTHGAFTANVGLGSVAARLQDAAPAAHVRGRRRWPVLQHARVQTNPASQRGRMLPHQSVSLVGSLALRLRSARKRGRLHHARRGIATTPDLDEEDSNVLNNFLNDSDGQGQGQHDVKTPGLVMQHRDAAHGGHGNQNSRPVGLVGGLSVPGHSTGMAMATSQDEASRCEMAFFVLSLP